MIASLTTSTEQVVFATFIAKILAEAGLMDALL
jgi:hypothetical protein